jgi:hypothetical protein
MGKWAASAQALVAAQTFYAAAARPVCVQSLCRQHELLGCNYLLKGVTLPTHSIE